MPIKTLKTDNSLAANGSTSTIAPKQRLNLFNSDTMHFKPLFASLFLIFALYLVGTNWNSFTQRSKRYVTVTGNSTSQVKNEIASFTANVTVTNASKEQAISQANEKIKVITDAVKAYGVDEKDIQTRNVNVFQMEEPFLEDGVQKYAPGDWRAYIGVEITYRDLDSVNAFAQMLSLQDLSDMSGPNFQPDTKKLDDSALLKDALEDAQRKADYIAGVSGGKLGKVYSILEGPADNYGVMPVYSKGMMGGGGGTPLEPGSTQANKTVTVTYELIVK